MSARFIAVFNRAITRATAMMMSVAIGAAVMESDISISLFVTLCLCVTLFQVNNRFCCFCLHRLVFS